MPRRSSSLSLHAYANAAHEDQAVEIARASWPGGHVTASSRILREVREYERGSTAAVNAFVQPVLSRYLGRLEQRLEEGGFTKQLLIMQGNGGTMSAAIAKREPVQTVMSRACCGCPCGSKDRQPSGAAKPHRL